MRGRRNEIPAYVQALVNMSESRTGRSVLLKREYGRVFGVQHGDRALTLFGPIYASDLRAGLAHYRLGLAALWTMQRAMVPMVPFYQCATDVSSESRLLAGTKWTMSDRPVPRWEVIEDGCRSCSHYLTSLPVVTRLMRQLVRDVGLHQKDLCHGVLRQTESLDVALTMATGRRDALGLRLSEAEATMLEVAVDAHKESLECQPQPQARRGGVHGRLRQALDYGVDGGVGDNQVVDEWAAILGVPNLYTRESWCQL